MPKMHKDARLKDNHVKDSDELVKLMKDMKELRVVWLGNKKTLGLW